MNERLATWFPLLLLAVLAGLTFWLDRFVQPPAATRGGAARHDPDYIVDGLSAVRMSPEGKIKHTLSAEKMVHYPDDDSTHLQSPRFVNHAAPQAPVTITAREALVSGEGENFYFYNDVHVTRAPYAEKSPLEMQTSYLHVIPDDNLARTDRAVTITDAHTIVTAVGLELNTETRVLRLLSRVKGTFHDPKTSTRTVPGG